MAEYHASPASDSLHHLNYGTGSASSSYHSSNHSHTAHHHLLVTSTSNASSSSLSSSSTESFDYDHHCHQVAKKPRLDISSSNSPINSNSNSLDSTELLHKSSRRNGSDASRLPTTVATNSSNEVDLNGGDSGFQDFSSNEEGSPSNSQAAVVVASTTGITADRPLDSAVSFFSNKDQTDQPIANHSKQEVKENVSDVVNDSHSNVQCEASTSSRAVCSSTADDELVTEATTTTTSTITKIADEVDRSNVEVEDDDDRSSVISDISCLSSLSDLEDAEKWQSNFAPINWVQQQMTSGTNPRHIISEILPNSSISSQVDNLTLWKFIVNILSEPPKRRKLPDINSIQDVVGLIEKSKKILVLTGAGISVSSGIPDFRSKDGVYARLSVDFPDLPDPQAMFDINYFSKDQRPFFKFAKEIIGHGQFKPSICHRFIRQVEKNGKLLRNYTQNIDTLEKSAGIERVITCHGSFSTATCTNCKYKVDISEIREDIYAQRIPMCPKCVPSKSVESAFSADGSSSSTSVLLDETDANIKQIADSNANDCQTIPEKRMAVMKPDIVFFGEGLPDEFHDCMSVDKNEVDLLIVIGSSLKVKPVALIPTSIPPDVPQILINREPLPHMTFDVELLGDCDVIVQELCNRLGENWNDICVNGKLGEQVEHSNFETFNIVNANLESNFLCFPPNRYVFKGAELHADSDDSDNDEDDI